MENRLGKAEGKIYLPDGTVACESAMQSYVKSEHPQILDKMKETLEYSDEVQEGLHAALKDFKEKGSW